MPDKLKSGISKILTPRKQENSTTMASNGGGIGRFARRQTDAPTKAPAPVPPSAANNTEKQAPSPNNDFGSFDGGAAMESSAFDNVGMFGGSFDMNFDADKTSYDYNDFGSFSMSEQPEENVLGSNDSAGAVAASGNTQSTIPSQESLANTPVTGNKSTGRGPFQFRASQGKGAWSPRPKTAAPPQPSGNKSGLSMFASRKTAARNQEPTAINAGKTPASSHLTVNNGESTGAPPTTTGLSPPSANTLEDATHNNDNENELTSPFTRVIPPPSIVPSKPPSTQMDRSVPSTTPKGPSINTTGGSFFASDVSEQEDFATPLPPPRNNTTALDTNMMHKTGSNMPASFITPEAPHNNGAMEEAFLGELDKGTDSFDDLLSLFLADLRSTTDMEMHGQAELLELEVSLSRAHAGTLQDRSHAMDLLDGISSCIESVEGWCYQH